MAVGASNQSQSVTDFTAFDKMRSLAREDQSAALPKVAKQFEAIFIQSMLKSMRDANGFLSENNPLNSKDIVFFRDMLDQQMSVDLANQKGIGLAEVMIRQMQRSFKKTTTKLPEADISSANKNNPSKTSESGKTLPLLSIDKIKTNHTFTNKSDFINALWPYAKSVGKAMGLDPKMLLAQAALETGWGKSIIRDTDGSSSHNVFNIKARRSGEGEKVSKQTIEFISGIAKKVIEPFKKYSSYLEGFNDYLQLLTSKDRYHKAIDNAADAKKYIWELQQAGYATDPHYATKIISIYEGDEFNRVIDKLEVD